MSVQVRKAEIFLHNIHTRMPFRYGIAEMTSVPHLFLKLECVIDGIDSIGFSAESLIPKWFTKDPDTSYYDELAAMFSVIEHACDSAVQFGRCESPFNLWLENYKQQERWAKFNGYPSLLWNLGVSLVERALIDAFCRNKGLSLAEAVHSNQFGIRLEEIHPELVGKQPANLLHQPTLEKIHIRHTVGLSDYLSDRVIPTEDKIYDGLPQSLEGNIQAYGLRYFKIKVNGDLDRDIERMCSIDQVFKSNNIVDYWFTLDGNEQYLSVSAFKTFWEQLTSPENCALDQRRLLFVEQPFHRSVALSEETGIELSSWDKRPLMIIDESDSEIGSLKEALENGYAGTSHKNCKGVFKSIVNACLLNLMREQNPETEYIMSGEDLVNIGPVALMQDLSAMSLLGIKHVERNGHQYFAGLSEFSKEVQERVLDVYPELYKRIEDFATLEIINGRIDLSSCNQEGFGGNNLVAPDKWFQPKDNWNFESLNIH